ncbi:hypothetical protein BH24CHL3_BH24CHL3_00050 [soil metagenome]
MRITNLVRKPSLNPASLPIPDVITAEFLALLRAHGVTSASLFGGFANDSTEVESDRDLLVCFDRPVTLFDQLRLAERLRRVRGRPVDLTTEIYPAFAPSIIPTLVPLAIRTRPDKPTPS